MWTFVGNDVLTLLIGCERCTKPLVDAHIRGKCVLRCATLCTLCNISANLKLIQNKREREIA